jgi:hypothetical protein
MNRLLVQGHISSDAPVPECKKFLVLFYKKETFL